METVKQKKQNIADVKRELFRFIGHFIILSALSFAVMYLFFQSYEKQSYNINNDIIAYKEILNKQQTIKVKIDTIYYQMSILNSGKVGNDIFLENYISTNVQDTRKLIGSDSSSEFKQYSFLLSNLDSLMVLKDRITTITSQEQLALKDLNECMGKFSKVRTELAQDPTRGF